MLRPHLKTGKSVDVACHVLVDGKGPATVSTLAEAEVFAAAGMNDIITSVIGHQSGCGWLLVDAGWMAMSRDRGTAAQSLDQGYGVICDVDGNVLDELIIVQADQEHGVIGCSPGSGKRLPEFAIGTQLRILPNHACATAVYMATKIPATSNAGERDEWAPENEI